MAFDDEFCPDFVAFVLIAIEAGIFKLPIISPQLNPL